MGKSSLINRISRKNSAQVGNKPGVTKQKQWIRIENNIELLDTPGVLWPKFENNEVAMNLAYTGTIKNEILDEYSIAFNLIDFLYDNYKDNVIKRYLIPETEIVIIDKTEDKMEKSIKLIEIIGKKRGAIIAGGRIDETKVSKIILEDLQYKK